MFEKKMKLKCIDISDDIKMGDFSDGHFYNAFMMYKMMIYTPQMHSTWHIYWTEHAFQSIELSTN